MPPFLNKVFSAKNYRAVKWLLAAGSVLSVAALYYGQNPFLEAFEAKAYDLRFSNLRGPIPVNPDIAIIAIDDKSIAELGRYPWSRTHYVHLLDRLSAAGAKVVLFDVLFPETETATTDRAFAAAIRKAGNVVLATSFDLDKDLRAKGAGTHSVPVIERAAAGVGHINFLPEDDGVNRRSVLLIDHEGRPTPSLGLMGAMAALGEKEVATAQFAVKLGNRAIPVDGNDAMWINYTGEPGNYPRYSFADVAAGRVSPELLKNKVLFVGATALAVYDMRVTPFFRNVPGVEIHATVADDILSGRFVRRTGLESLFDLAAIIALGSLTFFLTMRMRLYSGMPAMVLLVSAYLGLSYWMFLQGHWVSMIYPPLAAATALLTGGSFRYLVLERDARNIRSMFSSYMSDNMVALLEENPDMVRIGGDDKDVTVLFTDIRSFTSFSERHGAQEVVSRLNEYLGAMVQIIHEHDGRVDKFIGDGIMANWGAPISQPDHATRAVACALAMQHAMATLTAKWAKDNVEPFEIRGGLQSGEVVAGNVGSHGKKMEYTLIGDTVNQASRLESTAKYYDVDFLVGESTYLQTRESFRYRELDRIRVVGKQTPVSIYELRGTAQDPADRLADQFGAALSLYRARQWAEAAQQFTAILAEYPEDTPSALYLERCRQFAKSPPPADWDGVYNRLDK